MKKEITNIASLDDIIFEGRNKNYGAYELRSNYKNRLLRALLLGLLLPTMLLFLSYTSHKERVTDEEVVKINPTILDEITDKVKLPEIKPIKEKQIEIPKLKKVQYSSIKLVNEAEVINDVKEIETGVISDKKEIGVTITTNVPQIPKTIEIPPVTNASTTNEATKIVDVLAQYNGNWANFLTNTLQDMMEGIEVEQTIAVRVEFIVDIDGSVTNIRALNGPAELQRIAERAITKSGNWVPGEIAGKKVKSYRIQKIVFQSPE